MLKLRVCGLASVLLKHQVSARAVHKGGFIVCKQAFINRMSIAHGGSTSLLLLSYSFHLRSVVSPVQIPLLPIFAAKSLIRITSRQFTPQRRQTLRANGFWLYPMKQKSRQRRNTFFSSPTQFTMPNNPRYPLTRDSTILKLLRLKARHKRWRAPLN